MGLAAAEEDPAEMGHGAERGGVFCVSLYFLMMIELCITICSDILARVLYDALIVWQTFFGLQKKKQCYYGAPSPGYEEYFTHFTHLTTKQLSVMMRAGAQCRCDVNSRSNMSQGFCQQIFEKIQF